MKTDKYNRNLKGVTVDVYDVLKAFNVTCPAMQHALKKMLCSGLRGHKDTKQDKLEAIQSIERSIELDNVSEETVEQHLFDYTNWVTSAHTDPVGYNQAVLDYFKAKS